MAIVSVEEVRGGKGLARFTEVPQALHGADPRFAPPVTAWERYRLSRYRNPYLRDAEVALLLARRGGQPAGRIAAHVPDAGEEGRFGFWACPDDLEVATALIDAAREWLADQGCTTMTGPWSFEPHDEPGVLVEGHDAPGTTGRPWRPGFEARILEAALGSPEAVEEARTWRLPTTEAEPVLPPGGPSPGQAGAYADPRIALEGIAAVPDVSDALRTTGLRSAWSVARRARERGWEGCTVVRCDLDPAVAVPSLLGAAGRAGYRWAVVPWSADPAAAPETVHRTYRVEL
jgi:hypothetical protein